MQQQMTKKENNEESNQYFRFQVFQGEKDPGGKVKKNKSVGMAYLRNGQNIYTLRLWMFSWDRYYILPNKNDSSKYVVMTREPNKNSQAKNKFYWNIVGSGKVDSVQGFISLEFDLLAKPIYVSIHPESSASSHALPEPELLADAA